MISVHHKTEAADLNFRQQFSDLWAKSHATMAIYQILKFPLVYMELISSREWIYRGSAGCTLSFHLDAADASSPATVPTLISCIRIVADGIKAQNSSNAVTNEAHLRK